jgi:hypothetical protein
MEQGTSYFRYEENAQGIDLKAHYENIYAVMDGVVTASGWDPGGGGNYIKVRHFNRFETAYLHLIRDLLQSRRVGESRIYHWKEWKYRKFYRSAFAFFGERIRTKH